MSKLALYDYECSSSSHILAGVGVVSKDFPRKLLKACFFVVDQLCHFYGGDRKSNLLAVRHELLFGEWAFYHNGSGMFVFLNVHCSVNLGLGLATICCVFICFAAQAFFSAP